VTGRAPWIVSGGLLVLAGGLTAASTWRHWTSCRLGVGAPTCLRLQERTVGLPLWGGVGFRDSVGAALTALAALALSVAWLLVIGWARGTVGPLVMALLVGLQPVLAVVLVGCELLPPAHLFLVATHGWLAWPAEVLVFPMLLGAGWILDDTPKQILRLMVLGWGVTSFGPLHHFVDYAVTSAIFGSTGSSPPGMGYVTAATQLGVGGVVVLSTLLGPKGSEPEDDDEQYGRDGFTLAA
jgi:hypothetical protein